MTQQIRALLFQRSRVQIHHTVAHNQLYWDLLPSSGVSEDSYSVLITGDRTQGLALPSCSGEDCGEEGDQKMGR
ncbi:rCG30725, isoform CRA_b [Rattus norvegicus]|uniref:RCG30725, isoform CRA_b n=1 Tax=Rattus norvegicus TaxID=10116 RepID=A6ISS4_RAT|nr:rCG30725, isoform CRA_b [Rattus norvegicus]